MARLSGPATVFRRPIYLFLDFDGTITQKDTMHLLAQCGYASFENKSEHIATNGSRAKLPVWKYFVDAYMHDYCDHLSRYRPEKDNRRTASEEIAWLRSLRPIEEASADRVIAAGVFDDVDDLAMSQAASTALEEDALAFRPGLLSLLTMTYAWNASIENIRLGSLAWRTSVSQMPSLQIVSVNWSRSWIAAAMERHLLSSELADLIVWKARVYANELPNLDTEQAGFLAARWDLVSHYHGRTVKCRTSEDKMEQMRQSLKTTHSNEFRSEDPNGSKPLTIYIGDSATDLECLLEADVGICIRDDPMGSGQSELADLCRRTNISVDHIKESDWNSDMQGTPCLRWASDFTEVTTWIDGSTAGNATAALQNGAILEDLRGMNSDT